MRRAITTIMAILLTANLAAADRVAPGAKVEVPHMMSGFGTDLYQRLQEERDGNLFFSPLSIHVALQMAWQGARGETEQEMGRVLRAAPELMPRQTDQLLMDLNRIAGERPAGENDQPKLQLHIANSLWVDQQMPLRQEFEQMLRQIYQAEAAALDFRNQPEPNRQRINQWVEQKTNERIKDLLPQGSIDTLTRLVLANAVYFKGDWLTPFPEQATQDRPFTLLDGSKVDVPTMHHREVRARYSKGEDFTMIALPYVGERLEMVIILPDEPAGVHTAIQKLREAPQPIGSRQIQLYLPKFRMETQYTLNEPLKAMGMPLAFDRERADFTGITDSAEGPELHITLVAHKAFVEVAEWGTEAAAATGVVVGVTSAPLEPPPVVRVDRPFVFMIHDRQTGSPLFLGRVMDPR